MEEQHANAYPRVAPKRASAWGWSSTSWQLYPQEGSDVAIVFHAPSPIANNATQEGGSSARISLVATTRPPRAELSRLRPTPDAQDSREWSPDHNKNGCAVIPSP